MKSRKEQLKQAVYEARAQEMIAIQNDDLELAQSYHEQARALEKQLEQTEKENS